jgi:hypothetical protein
MSVNLTVSPCASARSNPDIGSAGRTWLFAFETLVTDLEF